MISNSDYGDDDDENNDDDDDDDDDNDDSDQGEVGDMMKKLFYEIFDDKCIIWKVYPCEHISHNIATDPW